MQTQDLVNLLNSAAAVLECGNGTVSADELSQLIEDLLMAAVELEGPPPKMN
jgi:hypothetical protein